MTLRYKTEGFVFKKEDNLDANRIFSVFTKDFGRLEVVGRGIRKIDSKLRGGIDVFALSYIEFIQGRRTKTLTDAIFIERFKNLFQDSKILETAHRISQLADSFIRGQEPDEKVWVLLVDSFEKLNQCQSNNESCQMVYYYFFWNFMSELGYRPELLNCANCQQELNPYGLYFSNIEGGIICKNCYSQKRKGIKIKSDTVKVLRLIIKKDWGILSKLRMQDGIKESLKELSDRYYLYLSSNLSRNVES